MAERAKRLRSKAKRQRKGSTERLYDARWQRARVEHLAEHPLCVACADLGVVTEAAVVDHIVPHRGDVRLFWQSTNWQSLCKPCHDAKTARGL